MKYVLTLLLGLGSLLGSAALAHGPTPQKADETIAIAAPPEAVWAVLKDFGGVAGWNTALKASKGEGGNAAGATRIITLKNDGQLEEGLDEVNEAEKYIGYRLSKENVEVFPVSFYSATIAVKPEGDGSLVTWSGRFYRGDTSNFPPENLSDEAALNAMTAFFKEGLAGLKAKLEAKG
jgi:mxaD protein